MNEGLSEITFLGGKTITRKLTPQNNMGFLVVDLNSSKDTRKIMNFFNNAIAFPKEANNQKVYNFFKDINYNLVTKAVDSIESGDTNALGKTFIKFQEHIDSLACKDEGVREKISSYIK